MKHMIDKITDQVTGRKMKTLLDGRNVDQSQREAQQELRKSLSNDEEIESDLKLMDQIDELTMRPPSKETDLKAIENLNIITDRIRMEQIRPARLPMRDWSQFKEMFSVWRDRIAEALFIYKSRLQAGRNQ